MIQSLAPVFPLPNPAQHSGYMQPGQRCSSTDWGAERGAASTAGAAAPSSPRAAACARMPACSGTSLAQVLESKNDRNTEFQLDKEV